MNKKLSLILLLSVSLSQKSYPDCTSFCICTGDTILFGNTLDWHVGEGLVVVNKRNVTKTALWYSNPARWTSKYGSITINQWGREFPSRGMNEAGLVVGEMTLTETSFPEPDSRASITKLQWVQYQLDNCATVEEVIASDARIRIDPSEYHSHFLVADSNGNCVTMEWLNGSLVYHAHESLPVKALTNNTYASCLQYYQNHSQPPSSSDFSSNARFCRAALMMKNYDPQSSGTALDYAWSILESVGPREFNKWKLLFDIKNRRFHFRTNTNPDIRCVDLNAFDFDCSTTVEILDLSEKLAGDVRQSFFDYYYDLNYAILSEGARRLAPYLGTIPEWAIERMARYPETTTCNSLDGTPPHNGVPAEYELGQNFPNPFSQETAIPYSVPSSGNIETSIYNAAGRLVCAFMFMENSGERAMVWNSRDNLGRPVPSGFYFYRLRSPEAVLSRKMIVMRQ